MTANDKAVKQVRLLVDGKAPTSGHQDWSQPVARAPMADVQGWIWLLTPTQGSNIGSPVTFTGYGTAFEATISWEVRQAGKVVEQGTVQGGANGEFGEFSGTVQLPPGSYEMRVVRVLAQGRQPPARRHQDLHGRAVADVTREVTASGGSAPAARRGRPSPQSRCAGRSGRGGTPWRRPPRTTTAPQG